MKIKIVAILLLLIINGTSFGQIKKFGKVSKDEFKIKENKTYQDNNAIVLFKKRKTFPERGMLITRVQERILILNREGFEYAVKNIRLYKNSGGTEKVVIKANTYHLIGEEIKETKLLKKDIFKIDLNEFWRESRFTMPNLKSNCIIEWEYEIQSPFFQNIDDVVFQYKIPIKYIEAEVSIPNGLTFRYILCGLHNVKQKFEYGVYTLKEKDIPAIKKEPYVNNIKNYIGRVAFEIISANYTKYDNSYNQKNIQYSKKYAKTWDDVTKTIYTNDRFGKQLEKTNYFKEDLDKLLIDKTTKKEKIDAIYNFVKQKVKWNKMYGKYTNKGVRFAYKERVGNVAEMNLILIAMLRQARIDANPILVSTRQNGIPLFPTLNGYNYVICGIEEVENVLLLDASAKYAQPNILPLRALNWDGRIIREHGSSALIDLFPKVYGITNKRINFIITDALETKGTIREIYKNSKALDFRNNYNGLANEEVIRGLEKRYKNIEVNKIRINNKLKLDKPLVLLAEFSMEDFLEEIEGKVYFSPLLFLQQYENVFKSEERKYPIDFKYPSLTNYEVIITIPKSYRIEKVPEDVLYELSDNLGSFKYSIKQNENQLILKVTTKINSAIVPHTVYKELKNFFTKIVLKEDEKVILKKQ